MNKDVKDRAGAKQKMEKSLYFECYSGISGDMAVGALLDLGVDETYLMGQLRTLPVEGFGVEVGRAVKSGLDACDFRVTLDAPYQNHDHDMAYLYGHRAGREEYTYGHSPGGGSAHGHSPGDGQAQAHAHRSLGDVLSIIEGSGISSRAKQTAGDIFRVLAEAEAKAHGSTVEQVHFHEAGAVDSIVDIAAAAVCLDDLGVKNIIIPELYEGCGTVRCAHGILPVPVPAVINIASSYGLHLHRTGVEAELVTPTGAAIAAAVRTSGKLPRQYRVLKTGMGAGKRDYEWTGILRVMLIESEEAKPEDVVCKLESSIDDCTGEAMGHAMERLMEAGAKDVGFLPIYMKKNRPAYEIHIICDEEKVPQMEAILFAETTTIGIRKIRMERTVLEREPQTIGTSLGKVKVKICRAGEKQRLYPEYSSVAAIAEESGMAYPDVLAQIQKELHGWTDGQGMKGKSEN